MISGTPSDLQSSVQESITALTTLDGKHRLSGLLPPLPECSLRASTVLLHFGAPSPSTTGHWLHTYMIEMEEKPFVLVLELMATLF